jgi:hypothetical protein
MMFGRGIVETSDNFGAQGATPTHPDLLDWLANDFIKSGWDVKALLRKIALCATYRQDSRATPELLAWIRKTSFWRAARRVGLPRRCFVIRRSRRAASS